MDGPLQYPPQHLKTYFAPLKAMSNLPKDSHSDTDQDYTDVEDLDDDLLPKPSSSSINNATAFSSYAPRPSYSRRRTTGGAVAGAQQRRSRDIHNGYGNSERLTPRRLTHRRSEYDWSKEKAWKEQGSSYQEEWSLPARYDEQIGVGSGSTQTAITTTATDRPPPRHLSPLPHPSAVGFSSSIIGSPMNLEGEEDVAEGEYLGDEKEWMDEERWGWEGKEGDAGVKGDWNGYGQAGKRSNEKSKERESQFLKTPDVGRDGDLFYEVSRNRHQAQDRVRDRSHDQIHDRNTLPPSFSPTLNKRSSSIIQHQRHLSIPSTFTSASPNFAQTNSDPHLHTTRIPLRTNPVPNPVISQTQQPPPIKTKPNPNLIRRGTYSSLPPSPRTGSRSRSRSPSVTGVRQRYEDGDGDEKANGGRDGDALKGKGFAQSRQRSGSTADGQIARKDSVTDGYDRVVEGDGRALERGLLLLPPSSSDSAVLGMSLGMGEKDGSKRTHGYLAAGSGSTNGNGMGSNGMTRGGPYESTYNMRRASSYITPGKISANRGAGQELAHDQEELTHEAEDQDQMEEDAEQDNEEEYRTVGFLTPGIRSATNTEPFETPFHEFSSPISFETPYHDIPSSGDPFFVPPPFEFSYLRPHEISGSRRNSINPNPMTPPSLARSQNSAGQRSSSIWQFLKDEVYAEEMDGEGEGNELEGGIAIDGKWDRIKNFFEIPAAVEKNVLFGSMLCLDSFLFQFTILPIRSLFAILGIIHTTLTTRSFHLPSLSHTQSLIRMSLVIIPTTILILTTDASKMYHLVRGQDTIKLYVIFGAVEVADKLCCAFGQDVLDTLFAKETLDPTLWSGSGSGVSTMDGKVPESPSIAKARVKKRERARPVFFWLLAVGYIHVHALVLFYQLVCLNVAINSYDNALLTLLVSNQFTEIKGSVFKKFEKENLFQILCADIVERYQLSLMLSVIAMRNLIEMAGSDLAFLPKSFIRGKGALETILSPALFVILSEMVTDWLKHAFITKFNHVRSSVYERYTDVLCKDMLLAGGLGKSSRRNGPKRRSLFVDQSPLVTRRLGLATLPLCCLVIRVGCQGLGMLIGQGGYVQETEYLEESGSSEGLLISMRVLRWVGIVLVILIGWILLVAVKLLLGVNLLAYAAHRERGMADRQEQDRINDFGRPPISESKQEKMYTHEVTQYLSNSVGDLPPSRGKIGKAKYRLEEVERWTMVKRIF